MTTRTVITVGLAAITLFNVVLAGLRTFAFSHSTSRIDVELGATDWSGDRTQATGMYR